MNQGAATGPSLVIATHSYRGLTATLPSCEGDAFIPRDGCVASASFAVTCDAGGWRLPVVQGETHTIYAVNCSGDATVRLTDLSGKTILARGVPDRLGPACSRIVHRFDQAGVYVVSVEPGTGWGYVGAIRSDRASLIPDGGPPDVSTNTDGGVGGVSVDLQAFSDAGLD